MIIPLIYAYHEVECNGVIITHLIPLIYTYHEFECNGCNINLSIYTYHERECNRDSLNTLQRPHDDHADDLDYGKDVDTLDRNVAEVHIVRLVLLRHEHEKDTVKELKQREKITLNIKDRHIIHFQLCVLTMHINVIVNVHVYSPDIPVGSADCTIYSPGIGTHSFTVSSSLGRIQHLHTLLQL